MFTYFTVNNLNSPNHSKFRPGNSCANQLVVITHEMYKSFDDGLKVKEIFEDISKPFESFWYGWLLKLNRNSISGNPLTLLRDLLNCQHSSSCNVNAGAPQALS